MGKYSKWLNTKVVTHPKMEKPCIKLGYCPYGQLVEEFPFSDNELSCTEKNGAIVQFGHDCPAHYHAEFVDKEYGEVCEACRLSPPEDVTTSSGYILK